MTEKFRCDGPGFYKQRDGGKAEIVAFCRDAAFGFDSEGDATSWEAEGEYIGKDFEDRFDLVAKWSEPRTLEIEIWETPQGGLTSLVQTTEDNRRGLSFSGYKLLKTIAWTEGQSLEPAAGDDEGCVNRS